MVLRTLAKNISELTLPDTLIVDEMERTQARLLSGLLLILTSISGLLGLLWLFWTPPGVTLARAELTSLSSSLCLLFLHRISMTRHYKIAGYAFWAVSILAPCLSTLGKTDPTHFVQTLAYLAIPVFVGSTIFTPVENLASLVIYGLVLAALARTRPDIGTTVFAMNGMFLLIIGVTTFFFSLMRAHVLFLISQQNQKLLNISKFAALGEMSAGLAHEINNPLTIIINQTELLKHSADNGTASSSLIATTSDRITATALRISRIVRGLRAFAQGEQGLPMSPTPIATIVEETLGLSGDRLSRHNVILRHDQIPMDWRITCHPLQISQVLLNLISNAIDAIEALPANDQTPWVEIRASESLKSYVIRVTDSGPGIPHELRDKIFQPFFTTKEIGKGTGMGLSVSKGIIEAHGGTLELNPRSRSTEFLITLPKSRGHNSDQGKGPLTGTNENVSPAGIPSEIS